MWCEDWRGKKLRENNLRVRHTKNHEIYTINGDKAIGPNIFYPMGNQMDSNDRVCAALK